MFETCRAGEKALWVTFVDLKKAYDSVDRARLFRALASELGIAPYVLCDLRTMYRDVRA